MPSLGRIIHEMEKENLCSCCPFGFHIDRDFVPFTKRMLSREGDVDRLEELKEKWRSERQSMNSLLGIDPAVHKGYQLFERESLSRASIDIWRREKCVEEQVFESERIYRVTPPRESPTPPQSSQNQLSNGLAEAVNDFEQALQKTLELTPSSSASEQKFHTFPRLKSSFVLRDPDDYYNESAGANAMTKELTAKPSVARRTSQYSNEEENKTCSNRDYHKACSRGLKPSPAKTNVDSDRLKQLEEQVKLIPQLKSKISSLTEERKELKKLIAERVSSISSQRGGSLSSSSARNGGGVRHLTSLEVTLDQGAGKRTKEIGVGTKVSTKDAGINSQSLQTRSIGTGSCVPEPGHALERSRADSASPTGSTNGSLRRRMSRPCFEIGIQVQELELEDRGGRVPLLKIIESLDVGVQTEPERTPRKPHVVNVSVSAKPKTRDFGVTSKQTPNVDINGELRQKKRTRDWGVSVNLLNEDGEEPTSLRKVLQDNGVNTELPPQVKSTGVNTLKEEKANSSSYTQTVTGSDLILPPIPSKPFRLKPCNSPDSERNQMLSLPPRDGRSSPSSRIPRLTSPIPSPRSSPAPRSHTLEEAVEAHEPESRRPYLRPEPYAKELYYESPSSSPTILSRGPLAVLEEEKNSEMSSSSSSTPAPPAEPRKKVRPSREMQGALKVLNDALLRGRTTQQVTNAISIILQEWFRISATKTADPFDVEDYLDSFEAYSPKLLAYIVNMPDENGNNAIHYAVSHGNFDVVSVLLDSKVVDPNKANKAGYTCIMLVSLAKVVSEAHRSVVRRLFSLGDVNIKAQQHGQTALMLAAAHGRFNTVKLLLEAGADINIRDGDGSTALLCCVEHGHGEIVKYLLTQPDCDPSIADNDGITALDVAMEYGLKDIGVMLYAHMHFLKSPSSSKNCSPRLSLSGLGKRSQGGSPKTPSPPSSGHSNEHSPSLDKKYSKTEETQEES